MKQVLNWFRRSRMEDGLDRELQYHMDRRVEDLMESGLKEDEARRQATLELGGLTQVREEVRDVWLTRWMRDFAYDLRFSMRLFRRSPSFTITTVLSLALGIGATSAIYSLVDQVILHSLPVRAPERLVLADWKGNQLAPGFGSYNLLSYPLCLDLQKQTRFFEGALCRAAATANLSVSGDPKPVGVEIVSGSYFHVLGVGAAMGRVLQADDDTKPGANPVVVLAWDYWKSQLGGAPDVVGRKVLINQQPMTVVGIAAQGFRGVDIGEVPALWLPASMSTTVISGFKGLDDRRMRWMQVLVRLADGVSLEQARAGIQPWFKAMLEEDTRLPSFPIVTPERRREFLASALELTPAPQGHSTLRRRIAEPLWVLLAATAVLLGLACLNVAGLFLARGSAREREITTRLALGASRGRLGRQLLADSLLLSVAGGALGVVLAPLLIRGLLSFLPQGTAEIALHAGVDGRLLLFATAVSVCAGLLSGFAPALHAGRESLIASLRERGGSSGGSVNLRKLIVTAQIAFTLVLIVGAALFVRTLTELVAKGPGFETTSLVYFSLDPLRNGYSRPQSSVLLRRVHDELGRSPVVQSAAVSAFGILLGGSWSNPMTIQGTDRIITDRDVHLNAVTPDYFDTLGVRLVAGRKFDDHDVRGDSPRRVAIVNEAFVRRYFKGKDPMGVLICQGNGPDARPDTEIVGVVSDFSYRGMRENGEQAFFPYLGKNDAAGTFYVKVRGTPDQASQVIRSVVREADPALPVTNLRTLNEQVERSLNTERMLATLSGGFGVLALVLSLVGLYGVMSFVVTQRTREIGIRMALGASTGSAMWLVLRDCLLMTAAGVATALPVIHLLGRFVESQLFGVTPADPASLAGAVALLTAALLGAAMVPAIRAARLNPTEALRLD